MSNTVLTLLEATISLYPTAADGTALTSYPIWAGAPAEGLRLSDSLIESETRPTAAANPTVDHLGEMHEIEIQRIWKLSPALEDFRLLPNQKFVLVIGWQEEGRRHVWHERTYHGVTMRSDVRSSEGVMHSGESQSLRAESLAPVRSGVGPYTPGAPAPLAMEVRWVKGRERLTLFDYHADTHTFTERSPGIATGRAALTVAPAFEARIESVLAMAVTASGIVNVGALIEVGAIAAVDSPRLEFWRGEVRMATLAKDGTLRVLGAEEGTPTAGADKFEFYIASTLAGTFEAAGLEAIGIAETL